jgi:hypothetical protein
MRVRFPLRERFGAVQNRYINSEPIGRRSARGFDSLTVHFNKLFKERIMDEQVKSLWSQLESARKKLDVPTGTGGGGAEKKYAAIYQQLVALGAAPQLRKRYR